MQADRGLVEDVEDADELRADLGRQAQPLRLAARERLRGSVELQVADPDVVEEGQALPHLLDDPAPDQLLGPRQVELVEERERPRHRHLRESVDRLLADRDCEDLGLQAGTAAFRARTKAHVLLDPIALLRGIGLAIAPLEVRHQPLERHRVLPSPTHPVPVGDEDLVAARAEQEPVLLLALEVTPRRVERDLVALGDRLDDAVVEALAADRPRHERALVDREGRVRNEQIGVDLELCAEPGAAGAGSVRRVEGEDARLELRQRHPVLGAGEVLGERQRARMPLGIRAIGHFAVDHVDHDETLREGRRGLDRLCEPLPQVRLHREAIDDDLDRVLVLLVELDLLLEQSLLAVDLDPREAVAAKLLEDVLELALAVANDRGVHCELRPFGQAEHLLDDLVERLACDRSPADRAVRPPDSREEEPEVVVDLRDGPYGRAWVARGRLLVDRDRR